MVSSITFYKSTLRRQDARWNEFFSLYLYLPLPATWVPLLDSTTPIITSSPFCDLPGPCPTSQDKVHHKMSTTKSTTMRTTKRAWIMHCTLKIRNMGTISRFYKLHYYVITPLTTLTFDLDLDLWPWPLTLTSRSKNWLKIQILPFLWSILTSLKPRWHYWTQCLNNNKKST